MKIKDIYESTTAGAIATVATPMTTQSRNASIYGGKKGGNLLTGKKTNKKYANSVNESKMKQVASDLETMQDGNFKQKYGKTKEQIKFLLGDPHAKKTVHEADLQEDDLILVPGQGHKLKSGFIPHEQDRRDHEVEMAKSDLFQAAKNAKQVYELIHDVTEDEGLEGWVQEKIIKANDYLNTIREYLEGKQLQNEMNGGVIAGGGVGEGLAESEVERRMVNVTKKYLERFGKTYRGTKGLPGIWQLLRTGTYIEERLGTVNHIAAREKALSNLEKDPRYYEPYLGHKTVDQLKAVRAELHPEEVEEGKGLWANIHAKRERIKHGSGERMRKPGSKGAPSAKNFRDAAK